MANIRILSEFQRSSQLMFPTTTSQRLVSLSLCRCCAVATSLLTISVLSVRSWCCGGRRAFMCGNSSSSMTNCVVQARATHTGTLIFLHGLGDTGQNWCSGLEDLVQSANLQHIKIICPTAPVIPVTLNLQMRMPAWFDITSLTVNEQQDEEGIKASSQMLNHLIEEEEKNGVPSNRIIIGGFSQGGAIALYTALTVERQLAGILALSTWLPLHTQFPEALAGPKREYPVLQCHGSSDSVINMNYGIMASGLLKKYCVDHTFKKYAGMGHSSSPEEMKDVQDFIAKVLPGISSKN